MSGHKVVPIHGRQCWQCGTWERPLMDGFQGDKNIWCWDCALKEFDRKVHATIEKVTKWPTRELS